MLGAAAAALAALVVSGPKGESQVASVGAFSGRVLRVELIQPSSFAARTYRSNSELLAIKIQPSSSGRSRAPAFSSPSRIARTASPRRTTTLSSEYFKSSVISIEKRDHES